MNWVQLRRVDPAQNKRQFYSLALRLAIHLPGHGLPNVGAKLGLSYGKAQEICARLHIFLYGRRKFIRY